ncbi:glycosyltransferase family 2 protein [Epibacterium ulvae]|uniref:glycosyltransferase family 2 protein n=1 Tax=Epibacterium ulvae TaxID=1156985 RepID=UPI001BFC26B2|nr:glycosyltransferase family 2 protein [Epibacterium ulvae]MBT8154546.1 glycosyltransferase family 2 protein [Epibacterium ulvae]
MTTGVVLVAFNSGPLLVDCVQSLLDSQGADLRILVVDNGSAEDTGALFAASDLGAQLISHQVRPTAIEPGQVALWTLSQNHGFAGGVNHGLRAFMGMEDVDHIWVLNPDAVVLQDTAAALETRARELGQFGMIGGRVCYGADQNVIQSDGGRVNRWTGITSLLNNRKAADQTDFPAEEAVDFVFGAHMFVSKDYIRRVGYMPEDYFLYYEETDWCLRRGDDPALALYLAPDAVVYHVGGATIGSKTTTQAVSSLSSYFMARSRMRFMRRHWPRALPFAFAYTAAKVVQLMLQKNPSAARACLYGLLCLPVPKSLRAKIGTNAVNV